MKYHRPKNFFAVNLHKLKKETPLRPCIEVLLKKLKGPQIWRNTVSIEKLNIHFEENRPFLVLGKLVNSKRKKIDFENQIVIARAFSLTALMALKEKNNTIFTYFDMPIDLKKVKILK
jgi:ribosomal protein L18E